MNLDIAGWVEGATGEAKQFRQAVHTILFAIASSDNLKTRMVIKGGILLAIEFQSTRFTKDIDFSTKEKGSDFNIEEFLEDLSENLNIAVNTLPYELNCRVQSHEMKPSNKDASFPTLTLKIAYAHKGEKKHKFLVSGRCPSVVAIDYSFNELNTEIDTLNLTDEQSIKAYSLVDLVAEKYRAIIQQKTRDRTRRQDHYDIYRLLEDGHLQSEGLKQKILNSLLMKSKSRNLEVFKESLMDQEIIDRSKKDYGTLATEIEGDLPPFELVYSRVSEFYEALPW